METQSEERPADALGPLSDQRFERLLTIARQMNDLKVRIHLATDYLWKASDQADLEDVRFAREQLVRDLERNYEEADTLLPIVRDLVGQFKERIDTLGTARKLHQGLAKIEQMAGSEDSSKVFERSAGDEFSRVQQIESLLSALGSLEEDVDSRRKEYLTCPRCNGHSIAYKIQLSDTGYTLYRCNSCSNAWSITRFSLRIG